MSKQKEIFNKIIDEKLEKIIDLDKKVNNNDLICKYKGKFADTKFNEFDNALGIINKIRDSKEDLADVKKNQQKYKYYLGEIKKGTKKLKNKKTQYTILKCSIKQAIEATKFYNDYSLMMSEAKTKAKKNETKGTGLKILTPKKMIQRLPIAFAQIKAGNNPENLLNEMRQIIYSLYQSK